MEHVLNQLLPLVLTYKYSAIFVISFLGGFALPIPSGTVLMAAVAFAMQGTFNPWGVFAIGLAGKIAGDHSNYWISRTLGRNTLEKTRLKSYLYSNKFLKIEEKFIKHPIPTIFLSRFFTAVAPSVNIVTGVGKYPYGRYTFFEIFGELTEVSMNCGIGFFFGSNWQYIQNFMGKLTYLTLFSLFLSFLLWRKILNSGNGDKKTSP